MTEPTFTALQMMNNGNTGNRMFQYAYLKRLQDYLPRSEIFGADILDFVPATANYTGAGKFLRVDRGHIFPFGDIARMIREKDIAVLHFGGYVQRMEYLGTPGQLRSMFSLPGPSDDARFRLLTSDRHITCIVRANEILTGFHPDYPPAPVAFFRAAVEDSGRIPVLVGQTSGSFYADSLRKLFPDCEVYEHLNPIEDFRFILHSTNIALAISTFAWMAGYLSASARRIYMPAFGIYNKAQRSEIDLVPAGDARYRLAQFPRIAWKATESQIAYVTDPKVGVSFRSV